MTLPAKLRLPSKATLDVLVRRVLWAIESTARHVGDLAAKHPWTAERLQFFYAWRRNPQGIGAIVPSSNKLARAITRHVSAETGPIIELGSGTGAFTRELVKRGVDPADLALIEMDPQFASQLIKDYPRADVQLADASKLADRVLFDGEAAGAAICGLPLLNFPLKTRVGILRGTFQHLKPGGAFYFFTYGLHCPIPLRVLDHLRLRATKVDVVLVNVPPAHVWKITRRGASAG